MFLYVPILTIESGVYCVCGYATKCSGGRRVRRSGLRAAWLEADGERCGRRAVLPAAHRARRLLAFTAGMCCGPFSFFFNSAKLFAAFFKFVYHCRSTCSSNSSSALQHCENRHFSRTVRRRSSCSCGTVCARWMCFHMKWSSQRAPRFRAFSSSPGSWTQFFLIEIKSKFFFNIRSLLYLYSGAPPHYAGAVCRSARELKRQKVGAFTCMHYTLRFLLGLYCFITSLNLISMFQKWYSANFIADESRWPLSWEQGTGSALPFRNVRCVKLIAFELLI